MCLLACPHALQAAQADYISVDNIGNTIFNFGTWSQGDGNQSITHLNCVGSSNYNNAYNSPPPVVNPPAVHKPYRVRITDRNAPTGFYFYLDNDDSNTGNARLPVAIDHRDVKYITPWETLADNSYEAQAHLGQFKNCSSGDNSELRLAISATDLEQVRAGAYRALLTFTGMGGSSGTKEDSVNFRADIRVSAITRVSGISDIPLGFYMGSDLTVEQAFCVYSNNDSAGYNIRFSSPRQDPGGAFFLGTGGTEKIPYNLFFKSSTTPGLGSPVGLASIYGVGNNTASNCGGGNNAKIGVRVFAINMDAATPSHYFDTVTILVSPQ